MIEGVYRDPATGAGRVVPLACTADGLLWVIQSVGLDTTGQPVPAGLAISYTNNASGQPLTATCTDGVATWVYSWTYDANGWLTAESGWVRQ